MLVGVSKRIVGRANLLGAREGTNEGTNAHQRHKQRLDDGLPFLGPVPLVLRKPVDEVLEQQHARDLTGVIAKEESAHGGDGPQQNGLKAAVGAIDGDRSEEALAEVWWAVMGREDGSLGEANSLFSQHLDGEMFDLGLSISKQERLEAEQIHIRGVAARPF